MPDTGEGKDKSGGERNTAAVYFVKDEGLWHAKIGPDADGRTLEATASTPGEALAALLVSMHWGEYRFDPEWHPG